MITNTDWQTQQEYTEKLAKLAMMGFYLETDDHFIVLRDKDNIMARWSATGVTIEEIYYEAIRLTQSQTEVVLV